MRASRPWAIRERRSKGSQLQDMPKQVDCDLGATDAASAGPGCERVWMDHHLRMNDILTVGTHNSYKQAISEPIMALIREMAPDRWWHLDYSHPPLAEQLDDGARNLELDGGQDPEGGRSAHPLGRRG